MCLFEIGILKILTVLFVFNHYDSEFNIDLFPVIFLFVLLEDPLSVSGMITIEWTK